jgi:2-amino-4-hydroxy-6-hydroxymethyldihydropteridine diphosphokinase
VAKAYVGLGSNIEPRRSYLALALKRLAAAPLGMRAQSSLYESEPVDVTDQAWFLNMVVELETDLEPLALLRALQAIEQEAGKKVLVRRGPRTLDLDLLLWGQALLETPELTLPHERLARREFALRPLAEIAPQARHPLYERSAAEMLASLPPGGGEVRCLGPFREEGHA